MLACLPILVLRYLHGKTRLIHLWPRVLRGSKTVCIKDTMTGLFLDRETDSHDNCNVHSLPVVNSAVCSLPPNITTQHLILHHAMLHQVTPCNRRVRITHSPWTSLGSNYPGTKYLLHLILGIQEPEVERVITVSPPSLPSPSLHTEQGPVRCCCRGTGWDFLLSSLHLPKQLVNLFDGSIHFFYAALLRSQVNK